MKKLGELGTLRRTDSTQIRSLYPEEAKKFPGKMKTNLAREIIRHFLPTMEERARAIVVDSMSGVGTTCVASILEGCLRFIGGDKKKEYVDLSQEARYKAANYYMESEPFALRNQMEDTGPRSVILHGRSEELDFEPYLKGQNVPLGLLSPPFPKSHSQGGSETQKGFLEEKGTYAGNEFESMEEWDTKEAFVLSLCKVISSWVEYISPGGVIAVHIKNFIEEQEEICVDEWVQEALEKISGLKVEGYFSAPLGYRSMFRELQRYHLRKIEKVQKVGDQWEALLECGHYKRREKDPGEGWKEARCVECGVIEGHMEIREERVVIARKLRKVGGN